MDKKPLVFWGFVGALILLVPASQLLPVPEYLRFSGKGQLHGHKAPAKIPEVRGKALVPIPLRYVETARPEVERLMETPAWQAANPDEKHDRLMEILVMRAADADYWSMSEKHQRQVGEAFIQAFLNGPPPASVDK